MVPAQTDFETAERLSQRRARALPALAVIFISQQATFLASTPDLPSARAVEVVRLAAWVALSLVLLFALWTNGFWFRPKAIRTLLNDEATQAHRADAMSLGFALAILSAIGLSILSMFGMVPARLALHIVITAGIGSALLRFGFLERRAHRVG